MSRIKSLIEGAHRAVEMRWTVLCYDPEKDNELVESSKQFDCICAAQTHKRELAMKHPGYIIEIVAESKKAKNESIGQEIVDEVKEEIKAELKDAIGQDVDNAIGHPATEENLGAEVKDDMEAEEDELAMEEDIDDDSDSIFAPDDLDEVVGESAEDDFKTKSLGAIAIAKAAGFKVNDRASKKSLIVLDKGDKEVVIGLYDYGILDITAYDKGEDTYSDHWKIDKVSKADIEKAAKAAIKSFNESAQKNEASDNEILKNLANELTQTYEVGNGSKYSVKATYDGKNLIKVSMSRVSRNFPVKKNFLLKLNDDEIELSLDGRSLDSIYKTMNTRALAGNFDRLMRDTNWGPQYELDISSKDKSIMSKLNIKPMTQNISGNYIILYYLPNKGYGINVASNGKVNWWNLNNKEYSSLEEASAIAKDSYPNRQQYFVGKVESQFYAESAQKNEAVNAAKVKQDVEKAVKDYFKNDKDALEYVYVDSKKDNHGRTVIEVRAELGYNGMTKLADHLDKVVQKHDRYAYFEQESGGIMTAVFESAQKNEALNSEPFHGDNFNGFSKNQVLQIMRDEHKTGLDWQDLREELFDSYGISLKTSTFTNLRKEAIKESAQKNEAIGPEDTVTHAKQMEFKKQYVAKRKPKVNMSSFYFDGPFAVDDNTGTNISGAKLGMKCKDLEVALDKFFLEDAEGMKALKKLTKENKFIVYCDGHAKYCKTRQEAEAHAKAIKAGQVKDLLGRTIKPTEPVKIEEIHESAQINESRNWEVLLKVSMPDNMNNRDVEDRIEELVDKHGFTVMDVTATRK